MNSTTAKISNQHPIPDVLATTIFAWTGVAFIIFSCILIGRKVALEYSRLRLGCLLMGIIIIPLSIANTQRIWGTVPESLYCILRSINIIVFVDVMVAITFDLGSRFYFQRNRINTLYWVTLTVTVITNILLLLTVVLQQLPETAAKGTALNNVMRIAWPLALFLAYWYAFDPVIRIKMGGNPETHSGVVTVGVWYLAGMGLFLVLHMIAISISVVYSAEYKELSIIVTTIGSSLRCALLDFYSFPPSEAVIRYLSRRLFPASVNPKTPGSSMFADSSRLEIQQIPGLQLHNNTGTVC